MLFSKVTLSVSTVLLIFMVLGAGIAYRLADLGGEEGDGDEELAEQVEEAEEAGVEVPDAMDQFDASAPQHVGGAVVVEDTLWHTVLASGVAEAFREAEITSRVGGQVDSVHVEDGDVVEAGDVLLQLDTAEFALDLLAAQADSTDAHAEFEVQMLQGDWVDDPEIREERERYARAQSGLDGAAASVQEARRNLEWTTVRAPFAGWVADVEVVEGQHLSDGAEVATLLQLDPIKVSTQVTQTDLPQVAPGRRASVAFVSFPGNDRDGIVRNVNPRLDGDAGTGRVTVELPNPAGEVVPGMYAHVAIESQAFADRVLVPREAILDRNGREIVWVAEDVDDQGEGRTAWRYVTLGEQGENLVEIVEHPDGETDMVEPGEVVLVDGHHYLAHDVPIRLDEDPTVPEAADAAAAATAEAEADTVEPPPEEDP